MHILLSGASSGVKSFHRTGHKSAVTMSGTDSPDSTSIAAASSVLPHNSLACGGNLSAVGSITLANISSNIHASIPSIPQATSPPGTTAINSSNGKHPHSMISPNVSSPGLLLSYEQYWDVGFSICAVPCLEFRSWISELCQRCVGGMQDLV